MNSLDIGAPTPLTVRDWRVVGGLFFLSGCSSLIYQLVWMRQLSLFFGSDAYSAAVILSCFMGGLSLGSFLVARLADRLDRPLIWYGLIEIAIGLYALAFSPLLSGFAPLQQTIYLRWFDTAAWRYQSFRVAVAAATLVAPTAAMGATLPLIVRRFVSGDMAVGRSSGFFYAINTAGALTGALGASFLLLPMIGVRGTTRVAVAINLAIGAAAILLDARRRPVAVRSSDTPDAPAGARGTRAPAIGAIAMGISGLAALALEVVWTRVLIQSFSATVYSFSIMVCCFLFGIFYGSERASTSVDANANPLRLLGLLELALGVSVAALGVASQLVPALFGRLLGSLTMITRGGFGVAAVVAQFLVSALLMIVPTVLLGATFPAAVRASTTSARHAGEGVGRVYALNTVGGVIGALVGGMVLIPAFGTHSSLAVIALIFAANGLWVVARSSGPAAWRQSGILAALAACGVFAIWTMLLPRQIVLNYNQAHDTNPASIYHGEGVAHTIDIVRNRNDDVIMMVDGNIEADTSALQRRHFILKGQLPLLLHPAPRDIAVVGLGLGITLQASAHHPGVQTIQVIELSREMLAAHAHLGFLTGNVLRDPRVNVRIDDGRNFLAMTDRTFDMITADPIHPRISGVGYLYTTEYYESIKRRLRPDGVVCQWMPMYQVSRPSFDVAFRSFASVFPYASFWYVRGHGLFVATKDPFRIDLDALARRFEDPAVKADLASIDIDSPDGLLAHMLMGPREIADYLAHSPTPQVNTDDNAYLEYRTPFEFLAPMTDILTGLLPFARLAEDVIPHLSNRDRTELQRRWAARKARILPELAPAP